MNNKRKIEKELVDIIKNLEPEQKEIIMKRIKDKLIILMDNRVP